MWRQYFRSLTTVFFSWRIYFEATAWQAEGVKRSGDAGHERRVDKISAGPANTLDQQMGDRPAHGRREAAGKRQRGNRPARSEPEAVRRSEIA